MSTTGPQPDAPRAASPGPHPRRAERPRAVEEWLGRNTDDYYKVLAKTSAGVWIPQQSAHHFLGAAVTLILSWNENLHQPGTEHKTTEFREWLAAHPRLTIQITPTPGSWLNLVGVWIADHRTPGQPRSIFTSVKDLYAKICEFVPLERAFPPDRLDENTRSDPGGSQPQPLQIHGSGGGWHRAVLLGGTAGGQHGRSTHACFPSVVHARRPTHLASRTDRVPPARLGQRRRM